MSLPAATAIAPLGLLIAGPFSDLVGIRVWFWAGGLLCILIAVAAFPAGSHESRGTQGAHATASN